MASKGQWNKYNHYLGIILVVFTLISCSGTGDSFNLVLKGYSSNKNTGTLQFKNLNTGKVSDYSIKTLASIDLDLDMEAPYSIKYEDQTDQIYGYASYIIPSHYNNASAYLTLNENKNFRSLGYILADTLSENETFYALHKEGIIYRALGTSFKKLSLFDLKVEVINKGFSIENDHVISIDNKFLINDTNIAHINKNHALTIDSHDVSMGFTDNQFIKIDENNYFFIAKNTDGNAYDCYNIIKQSNEDVRLSKGDSCFNITESLQNTKLLSVNNITYLWNNQTLYKYVNNQFTELKAFDKSGVMFQNNNKLYLISETAIYLVNLTLNALEPLTLNETLSAQAVNTFTVNDQVTLITTSYWEAGTEYFLFDTSMSSNPQLERKTFPDTVNLKNILNIKVDAYQNIFLNKTSFTVLNQEFNSAKFYLFSYFK